MAATAPTSAHCTIVATVISTESFAPKFMVSKICEGVDAGGEIPDE